MFDPYRVYEVCCVLGKLWSWSIIFLIPHPLIFVWSSCKWNILLAFVSCTTIAFLKISDTRAAILEARRLLTSTSSFFLTGSKIFCQYRIFRPHANAILMVILLLACHLCNSRVISAVFCLQGSAGCGCRIHKLHLYSGVRLPTSMQDMTLSNLMVKLY